VEADASNQGGGSLVPRHVAIIMDGNGRWAVERRLPRPAGHARGVDAVREVVEVAARRGVGYLTLFAFSSENWRRPIEEVSVLMRLFVAALHREVARLATNGVRLRVIGDLEAFDPNLRQAIEQAEAATASNTGLQLNVCASYGGRWDIVQAVRGLVAQQREDPSLVIDEQAISGRLALSFAPDPDLLIRTGGERRISNFLLWQLAYAELHFSNVLWPDFGAAQFDEALAWYAQRERRYGRTSAQVAGAR